MHIQGLLLGLGNPGPQYAHTRHNCGFDFIDMLIGQAERGGSLERLAGKKFSCELWKIAVPDLPGQWLCAKPLTFMNLSGNCAQPLLAWHRLPPERMIVIHDELDIAPGELRFKRGGGDAGHNGLKSITASLGGNDYYRLRVGIGRPPQKGDVIGWVLARPDQEDAAKIREALGEGLAVISDFARHGLEKAVHRARSHKPSA